jgi:hypothetical protein
VFQELKPVGIFIAEIESDIINFLKEQYGGKVVDINSLNGKKINK